MRKYLAKNKELHLCFIVFYKAFDRICRDDILKILYKRGEGREQIEILRLLYTGNKNVVRFNTEEFKECESQMGISRDER